MPTKRVIPCLDVKDGRVVKGVGFGNLRDAGDPVELAARYSDEGADEIAYLDISASLENRRTLLKIVERTADVISIPFSVGGGVVDVKSFRDLLLAGADKVVINTAAVRRPHIITDAAAQFGSQCVVVAIDSKRTPEGLRVHTHGGTVPTGLCPIRWAQEAVRLGAGEILLTSMDTDGWSQGYDIHLTARVADSVEVPVIASGGAGVLEHFREVFDRTRAEAALAASVFHYGVFTINQVKRYLASQGIEVRLGE
ncbi:MAG: imidazole glycerol phosphate synthase subunit HisF [Bacillota bacterium]